MEKLDAQMYGPPKEYYSRETGVEWYLIEAGDCYGEHPFEALARSCRYLNRFGLE